MKQRKKKISFFVNLSEKFEGRTKITLLLKNAAEKMGYEVVINEPNADLIHVHSSGIAPSFLINKFKKKHIPCIYSLYSTCESNLFQLIKNYYGESTLYKERGFWNLLKGFLPLSTSSIPLWIKARKLKKFDKVIVPSRYLKKKLFKNTIQINLGVNTSKFKPLPKKIKKKIVVGYIGHFGHFKGIFDFIKSTEKISKDIEIRYYISNFNNPGLLKRAEKIIKKANKNAKVFGIIDKIEKAYQEIDILVYPLRMTLSAIINPLVLLEAMSSGCAVITTDIPNIKEIVKDSSVTVKPNSPPQITKAIHMLIKNSQLRKKMGEKARKMIIKEYNEKIMIDQYLDLYNKLLK